MKKKELVIQRDKWLRGLDGSTLLDMNGQMCCLGFYAKTCGFKDEDILCVATPADITNIINDSTDLTNNLIEAVTVRDVSNGSYKRKAEDNTLCNNLMIINDDNSINDTDRENQLIEKFDSIDITLRFE